MSKKAGLDTPMFVILAVLGVIAILLTSFFAYKFYLSSKEGQQIKTCRNSIAAHSFLAASTSGDFFTDIDCPTRQITIENNNQEKAKKQLAEDMHRCWYEWGRGKEQLFEGEGVFCHVCSVYEFKDKQEDLHGMMFFLASNPVTVRYAGDEAGLSYAAYLQGYSTEDLGNFDDPLQYTKTQSADSTTLVASKQYASLFIYVSGKTTIDAFLEGKRGALLSGGGILMALGTAGGVGGSIAAVAIGSNPVGWIVGGVALVGVGAVAVYESVDPEDPQWIASVSLIEYNAESLRQTGCQRLEAGQDSHSG